MIDPRLYIGAAALVVSFASGWLVHGWKYDADKLGEEKARSDAYAKAVDKANQSSAQLESALSKLEANRFVTLKETHHETAKVEYRCSVPASGVQLFNRSTEPADSR